MKKILLSFLFAACFLSELFGQQIAESNITLDTRWTGEVLVQSDVVVNKGATLTILPGTRVLISPVSDALNAGKDPERVEIIIKGQLMAQGVEGNKITFTSASQTPKMHDWAGIVIKNGREASVIESCIIEYAYKGITCFSSAPSIINNEIRYNLYAGISCQVRAKPKIRKNTISSNEFAGIVCELASMPVVEQNIITQNENGVIVFDRSNPDLGHISPRRGDSRGENLILNNFATNIYNHSTNAIQAQNNLWNTADDAQIIATLFDKNQNPAKGEVVFSPVFESGEGTRQLILQTSTSAVSNPVSIETERETSTAKNSELNRRNSNTARNETKKATSVNKPVETPVEKPVASSQTRKEETRPPVNKPIEKKEIVKAEPKTTPVEKETTSETKPQETQTGNGLIASNTPPASSVSNVLPKTQPVIEKKPQKRQVVEPVIEALIDGGGRKYVKRGKPVYPPLYLKTGHQGKVLMEVIIARDGSVKNFRILKSDGDLFSDAATRAIKEYKYEPATYQGQPISYKIVEPFIFRLKK